MIRHIRTGFEAAKAKEHWDQLLRTAADFENFKKRAARERQEVTRYANESLLQRLIPVLDNFDALSMIGVDDGSRIISMGANPVKVFVNGNCKFDQAALSANPLFHEEMKRLLRIEDREQVSLPGPPMKGKRRWRSRLPEDSPAYPEMILILVPRHVDRASRWRSFWKDMKKVGIEIRASRPFKWTAPFNYVHRDHRKLIVIDVAASWCGPCRPFRESSPKMHCAQWDLPPKLVHPETVLVGDAASPWQSPSDASSHHYTFLRVDPHLLRVRESVGVAQFVPLISPWASRRDFRKAQYSLSLSNACILGFLEGRPQSTS
jgi:thiol-disulfide isomerase/thioredoxin